MEFTKDFLYALDHAMLYEVGKHWDSTDPDVINGAIATREQRRKVGYVNIPSDRGGETKYGIAKNANPNVDVRNLNLESAKEVYFKKYWLTTACDKIPYPISIIHFDGCINHGIKRGCKFLQRAAQISEKNVDGSIGPQSLLAIQNMDPKTLVENISDIRTNFYKQIVKNDASQAMFLDGWMTRITEVTEYTSGQLNTSKV